MKRKGNRIANISVFLSPFNLALQHPLAIRVRLKFVNFKKSLIKKTFYLISSWSSKLELPIYFPLFAQNLKRPKKFGTSRNLKGPEMRSIYSSKGVWIMDASKMFKRERESQNFEMIFLYFRIKFRARRSKEIALEFKATAKTPPAKAVERENREERAPLLSNIRNKRFGARHVF